MATWEEMSLECLRAAKELTAQGYLRSSISRSYYAAYCAVSAKLTQRGVQFARGWNNPAHEQLIALIQNGLSVPADRRRQVLRSIRRLRFARESADYRPGASIDRALALICIHDATLVLESMEE